MPFPRVFVQKLRCSWCNGYHCRKWTRRLEFKSRTRLSAFHIAQIPLRKVWIQLFSFLIFIIEGFRTIVFIFIVISTMFRPICSPAFIRCLSNLGTFTKLQTTSFIEFTGVACSDSVAITGYKCYTCNQDWTSNLQMIVSLEASGTNVYNRYAMCPVGHIV